MIRVVGKMFALVLRGQSFCSVFIWYVPEVFSNFNLQLATLYMPSYCSDILGLKIVYVCVHLCEQQLSAFLWLQ